MIKCKIFWLIFVIWWLTGYFSPLSVHHQIKRFVSFILKKIKGVNTLIFFLQLLQHAYSHFAQSIAWENAFFFQHFLCKLAWMFWKITESFISNRQSYNKLNYYFLKTVWTVHVYTTMHIQNNVLKRIVVKNEIVLNMQKIAHWFCYSNFVIIQSKNNWYIFNSVYRTTNDVVTRVGAHL